MCNITTVNTFHIIFIRFKTVQNLDPFCDIFNIYHEVFEKFEYRTIVTKLYMSYFKKKSVSHLLIHFNILFSNSHQSVMMYYRVPYLKVFAESAKV